MIPEFVTKSSLTVDTAFRKDLSLQGVYNVKGARFPRDLPAPYPCVPSGPLPVQLALFRGKPAGWERLRPLPRFGLTQDHQ